MMDAHTARAVASARAAADSLAALDSFVDLASADALVSGASVLDGVARLERAALVHEAASAGAPGLRPRSRRQLARLLARVLDLHGRDASERAGVADAARHVAALLARFDVGALRLPAAEVRSTNLSAAAALVSDRPAPRSRHILLAPAVALPALLRLACVLTIAPGAPARRVPAVPCY
jgi:hypothetical protein